MPKTANNVARNNGRNSFAAVIFNSIKSRRGARRGAGCAGMGDQVFTICRFTKARVHTFLHLNRFQDAFSSRSSVAEERKQEKDVAGFLLSDSLILVLLHRMRSRSFRSLLPEKKKGNPEGFSSLFPLNTGFEFLFRVLLANVKELRQG